MNVLLGFCCDEGVKRNNGRVGAVDGPSAFRKVNRHSYKDAGDIICKDGDLEAAQQELGEAVKKIVDKGNFPILIGGGHEIAYGHYLGHPDYEDLAILNIDAHFDLRPLLDGNKGTSGTSFTQIGIDRKEKNLPFNYYCFGIQRRGNQPFLFEEAKRLSVDFLYADTIQSDPQKASNWIEEIINRHERILLTICLDVFAQAFAPGVSAPQPLGLYPKDVIPVIELIAQSKKAIGLDVAELNPAYDQDGQTARLAGALMNLFL